MRYFQEWVVGIRWITQPTLDRSHPHTRLTGLALCRSVAEFTWHPRRNGLHHSHKNQILTCDDRRLTFCSVTCSMQSDDGLFAGSCARHCATIGSKKKGDTRMFKEMKTWMLTGLLTWAILAPAPLAARSFKQIVVFGASLSDPGNAFALTGEAIKRPYSELDDFLIPSAPYAVGGHHFSNGATWVEQFARRLGLSDSVEPAFGESETATNYAVGGARARSDGINMNLPDQVGIFLADVGAAAPADALYVIDMGANDVRDALVAGSLAEAQAILGDALSSIGAQMGNLYGAGARKFLVLNVPNLGVLPSVQILDVIFPGAAAFAGILADTFNASLDSVVASMAALPSVKVARLNVLQTVNDLIANPAKFGLKEVSEPCIRPDVRPFTCKKPDQFLFWDGVHPTKAVHAVFAKEAASALEVEAHK